MRSLKVLQKMYRGRFNNVNKKIKDLCIALVWAVAFQWQWWWILKCPAHIASAILDIYLTDKLCVYSWIGPIEIQKPGTRRVLWDLHSRSKKHTHAISVGQYTTSQFINWTPKNMIGNMIIYAKGNTFYSQFLIENKKLWSWLTCNSQSNYMFSY